MFDAARMTAIAGPPDVARNAAFSGRLVESAVGAHPVNAAADHDLGVFSWRERDREVDFIAQEGRELLAIEVKRGAIRTHLPGLDAFTRAFAHLYRPRRNAR